MRLESKKLLEDIRLAGGVIAQAIADRDFDAYADDAVVWDVLQDDLPSLLQHATCLLDEDIGSDGG